MSLFELSFASDLMGSKGSKLKLFSSSTTEF